MQLLALSLVASSLAASALAQVVHRTGRLKTHGVAGYERVAVPETMPATMGNATFDQLIDHDDPSLGTFSQFYYYDTQSWGGPGYPIILFTPGEADVNYYPSYLTANRTTGVVAEEIKAAVIVIGHRYWNLATPYTDLTTKNLQHLTLKNAISDLTNFAKNVRTPFDKDGTSSADKAPWVLMGGSYSGALSAWTASTQPGTFWAYHASSAPVEAVSDYYGYFIPVQEGMPKNCSKDLSLVVDHIDSVLMNGTADDKTLLKTSFGLEDVEHDDDFAAALENGPWLWQGNQFYANSGFFSMCDAIENVKAGDALPDENGVGLDKALSGFAGWFNGTFLPDYCANTYGYPEFQGTWNVKCFDTYNATSPLFTDMSLQNTVDRAWVWMTCNEPFGYWQTGATERPSIVSRLVDVDYWVRQCGLFFPEEDGYTYGIARGASEDQVNQVTKGWDFTDTERLIYVNGGFDPWRESGVSAEERPGGPLQSTAQTPVVVVPGGFHTSDLVTQNGVVNAGAKQAIDTVVQQLKTWVDEYPKQY